MNSSKATDNFQPAIESKRVYLHFFGLKEAPFSITPDPEFLFFSRTHQEVIEKILYGINSRMGFILLTGEVGTGKTTICRSILDSLEENQAETVYIINPSLSGTQLIASILDDLGIAHQRQDSKKHLIQHLNRFLLAVDPKKAVVIVVDDAQTMSVNALEDLRLLSNLETDKQKLLQMVLVGQPELVDLIQKPELRQLRQRVLINCRLEYLNKDELPAYISRRLFIAGNKGNIHFSQRATKAIFKASSGTPRLINKICDYALMAGYIDNTFSIDLCHIRKAISEMGELDFETSADRAPRPVIKGRKRQLQIVAVVLVLILSLGGLLYYRQHQIFTKPSKPPVQNSVPPAQETTADMMPPPMTKSQKTTSQSISAPDTEQKSPANNYKADAVSHEKIKAPLISRPYILLLGSLKSIEKCRLAATYYQKKNIEAHWNRIDLGDKGVWYRLFYGRFTDAAAARHFKDKAHLTKALILTAPWAITIGGQLTTDDLVSLQKVLTKHHYDTFIRQGSGGVPSLFCGAFVSRSKAEAMVQNINALGLAAQIVTP